MIEGIGIDLIRLERVRRFYHQYKSSLSRFLTPRELNTLAHSRKRDLPALIFAFKEAVFKALNYHWMNWKEIELTPTKGELWRVKLSGALKKWARKHHVKQVRVYGTVGTNHAFAYAMALKGKS